MSTPFEIAMRDIDAAHVEDPNKITINGVQRAYEMHYAEKCSTYLSKLSPNPSELLQLAIRAQHFRRWETPRAAYPMTRIGYHAWRTNAKRRQAGLVEEICRRAGFQEGDALRVGALIRKEGLKEDAETQMLEDCSCLVFLDDQFEQFSQEHEKDKLLSIVRKTWAKMSEHGHAIALKMDLSSASKEILKEALA